MLLNNTTNTSGDALAETRTMNAWEVWLSAFGLVTLINIASISGIFFFPLMKKKCFRVMMRTMIGLAIGSLSGSALFHLIPAAFRLESHEKDGHKNYLNIALTIWMAAWIILVIECCIKICVKMRAAAKAKANESIPSEENGEGTTSSDDTTIATTYTPNRVEGDTYSIDQLPIYRSTLSLSRNATDSEPDSGIKPPKEPIKSVAWIVIIGDSVHNFIDGVSIGTAFANNFNTGLVISIAIMCEEFPHELGDFAILINSGMTMSKALSFNLLSALSCYAGMAVGILLGVISWEPYIYAFAAGIFIYVSLADMVPEITARVDLVSNTSPVAAVKVLLNYNLGISVGIGILYVLALYQP